MKMYSLALLVALLNSYSAFSQMRNIYTDEDANNAIKNFSFYQSNEGYAAFQKWVGYTVDSGHTFTRKYVTSSNVDYNGYTVNLTFGFTINGVHAFSQDSLLLYGDYGNVMAILFSRDGGNTFKLVHQGDGLTCLKMIFTDASTGFALTAFNILKTTNRGITWVRNTSLGAGQLTDIKNYGTNYIVALSQTDILRSVNGGASWSFTATDPGVAPRNLRAVDLIDGNKIWVVNSADFGSIYYSANGGISWVRKNNPAIYEVSSSNLKFTDDSTGYFTDDGFDIYKTTDAGSIWEKLPRNTNYTYLGYSHNALFFYNNQQFWAGGGHGYLEITNNGGGTTLPNAKFGIDTLQLRNNGTVKLTNYSKQGSAYSYRWYKNNVLLSTTYSTSYISNQNYIDTLQLIVLKNGVADTATQIVDSRTGIMPCIADFTFIQSDTSRVAFTAAYQDAGRTHKWYFGDGTVDSSAVNPVHFYTAIGTFTVKHRIYNTISHCIDSTTATLTITRVQACLRLIISAVPDTFFTNKIAFAATYDATMESGEYPMNVPVNWTFGNGATATGTLFEKITYNSPGTYNVCLSLRNKYTGCISQTCKPIIIVMDTCNAEFLINANYPQGTYITLNRFEGKKLQTDVGKAHYWIINNADTIRTGNRNYLEKDFYKRGTDANWFNWYDSPSSICSTPYTREIDLDSLTKKIRHLLVDSITGCVVSSEKTMILPTRIKSIKITAVPDTEVTDIVNFNATSLYSGASNVSDYYSVWRKHYSSFSGSYNSTNNILMTYTSPGTYNYAVAANTCAGDNVREVYSINYKVNSLDSCGVKKPQVSYKRFTNNIYNVEFWDTMRYLNEDLSGKTVIYFGNGDTVHMRWNGYLYTYPQSGVYNYQVKAISERTGCAKVVSGTLEIGCPKPLFTIQKDLLLPKQVSFINKTAPDTTNVSYIWQFGNGDSSFVKNPVYIYSQPGVYKVSLQAIFTNGCNFKYDSVIVISNALCNIGNVFKDSTHTIICDTDSVNLLNLFNTTGYSLQWNTTTPSKVGLGAYRMLAVDANYCADTSYIRVVQDTAIFMGFVDGNWHNPSNWKANRLPTSKSHVFIRAYYTSCVLSVADVSVASFQIISNRSFRIANNRKITITGNCSHLPVVSLQ